MPTSTPPRILRLGSALAALLLAAGCSSTALYADGQRWQLQECRKLPHGDERVRCEKSTAESFERYKAEAEAARKARP